MKHFDYESIRERVIDKYNRHIVLALFEEFQRTEYKPIWSLHRDWYPIFMQTADPTEYETAMRLIGNWEHYTIIRNHPKIKVHMDKWAKEVEVKLRSEAVRAMFKHSTAPNGAAAAKWVAEGSFMNRMMSKKADKQMEEQVREELADKVTADMERLGLKVVSGGKS